MSDYECPECGRIGDVFCPRCEGVFCHGCCSECPECEAADELWWDPEALPIEDEGVKSGGLR